MGVATKAYCEVFSRKILPVARAYVASVLINEYNISQLRAAKLLGMKQPAVNYLVRGKRRVKYMDLLRSVPLLKDVLDDIVEEVKLGNIFNPCDFCKRLTSNSALLKQVLDALDEKLR